MQFIYLLATLPKTLPSDSWNRRFLIELKKSSIIRSLMLIGCWTSWWVSTLLAQYHLLKGSLVKGSYLASCEYDI